MTDYSQFNASVTSSIHADVARIRKQDELIGRVLKQRGRSIWGIIISLALAVGVSILLKSFIPAIIFGFVAAFFVWRLWGTGVSDEYMKEVYEEGLLVPGMVVNTQPLTVMAIANIVAYEGVPVINACYNLVVKDLDGAKKELYEKIPCSCFFCYEDGSYHSNFAPHPLYWGTDSQQEIEAALRQAEEDNKQNSQDEWEVLKRIAKQYPALENGEMILLDENYAPFGRKKYYESRYKPLNLDTAQEGYRNILQDRRENAAKDSENAEGNIGMGHAGEVPLLPRDIPGKDVYNRMIALACRFHVYKYISGHCQLGHFVNPEHPGLFTYIGDTEDFLKEFHDSGIVLSQGEYPLIYEKCLITTRGCYFEDKKLQPWDKVNFSIRLTVLNGLELFMNDTKIAEFTGQFEDAGYVKTLPDQEQEMELHREAVRLIEFLRELIRLFNTELPY